jgi:hypothetical protein
MVGMELFILKRLGQEKKKCNSGEVALLKVKIGRVLFKVI